MANFHFLAPLNMINGIDQKITTDKIFRLVDLYM